MYKRQIYSNADGHHYGALLYTWSESDMSCTARRICEGCENEESETVTASYKMCIRDSRDTRVGDTVTNDDRPCSEPLPGYKKVNPMVYCGMYPADKMCIRDSAGILRTAPHVCIYGGGRL